MRRLLLLRHAEAVHSSNCSDRERPLTPGGRRDAARVGAHVAETNQRIDLILVSDSTRTIETLELALAAYGRTPEVRIDKALYHAERRYLMALARDLPDTVGAAMIVGHNPAIGEFSAHYAGSGDRDALSRLSLGFPPGGLAIIDNEAEEWRKLRWGAGDLSFF